MHEFSADANKVDVHSNNTLKQLLFKIYTKYETNGLDSFSSSCDSSALAKSL